MIAYTSIGSRRALDGYAMAGTSKAALEATVRYAAIEAAPEGVRVNAICPGLVDTKALQAFPPELVDLQRAARATPMGRLVTPDEVAEVATWLTSSGASMITGQVIVVDGGYEVAGHLM